MISEIARVFGTGVGIGTTAAYFGITQATLHEWIARGSDLKWKRNKRIYRELHLSLKKAISSMEMGMVSIIMRAACGQPKIERRIDEQTIEMQSEIKPQWQAAAWLLERMIPEKYARYDPSQPYAPREPRRHAIPMTVDEWYNQGWTDEEIWLFAKNGVVPDGKKLPLLPMEALEGGMSVGSREYKTEARSESASSRSGGGPPTSA